MQGPARGARYNALVKIDEPALDFELPDLDGINHRLMHLRGRIVVVNFWSCACPHVERTDRLIQDWSEAQWGRQVSIIRIASNASETHAALGEAATRARLPLVLLDAGHIVADRYDVQVTPQVFVIDPAGILRYRGAVDDTSFARRVPSRFYLAEAVEALLHGKPPALSETTPYGCAVIREALE